MILKYKEFYALLNVIKYVANQNNFMYQKLCLMRYYKFFFLYNYSVSAIQNLRQFELYRYILIYLYRFFNRYIEILLVKYSSKLYINMYIYLNFFSFFFKFLNWYTYYLKFNSNVFILDDKSLQYYRYNINNLDINKLFNEIITTHNCKFFINLDKCLSKDIYRWFYELDVYILDLSHSGFVRENKYSVLQLLFLMRNLIVFCNICKNF